MVKRRQGLAEIDAATRVPEELCVAQPNELALLVRLARRLQHKSAANLESAVKPEIASVSTPAYQGPQWKKTRQILARSFYNELKKEGLSTNQVIELSAEILGLVTADIPGQSR